MTPPWLAQQPAPGSPGTPGSPAAPDTPSLLEAARQSAEAGGDPYSVFFWAAVIIALSVLAGMFALGVRKRLMRPEEPDPGAGLGFTLGDLRQMHAQGQLTDEEFARAKARMIANARADLDDADDEPDGEIHLDDEDGADGNAPGLDDKDDDTDR